MGYGLLGSVFNFLDPILDEVDPGHNKVQEWTTGSKATKGQRPWFEAIAPIVLDAFLPGVGSAVGAVDKGSTGNWTGAALSALGSYAQMGSLGSSAASGAEGGLAATESTGSGLSSTGGDAAGTVAAAPTDYSSAYSANTYGNGFDASSSLSSSGGAATGADGLLSQTNSFGQPVNEFGYSGLSSPSSSASNTQFMTMPTSQFSSAAGVGGVGQGLEGTSAAAAQGSRMAGTDWTKIGTKGAEMYLKQSQSAEQQAKQRAALQQAKAQSAMGGIVMEPNQTRPAMSLQTTSPYSQFNGGFNPKRYGANVRNRGLLG